MNPFQHWYNTNSDMRGFIKEYYENNISKLEVDNEEIISYMDTMYRSEKVIDKLLALTVLGVNKVFFNIK
jgi:asparagine synthase (glutamine-hydrolysing)